jgi:hypothetical protein
VTKKARADAENDLGAFEGSGQQHLQCLVTERLCSCSLAHCRVSSLQGGQAGGAGAIQSEDERPPGERYSQSDWTIIC